ncbi:MAG: tetratricopeptide repeat protein [Bacteroides sp.]|nr:tetratricopeptide repeat protein [Bacteroides sp.]
MKRSVSPLLLSVCLLCGACQSVEQLSIDYMKPAEVNFPNSLRRVAVVNNMPQWPADRFAAENDSTRDIKLEGPFKKSTRYYSGDAQIATESLAQALADQEYFDEVIICDSALQNGYTPGQAPVLSRECVAELAKTLEVDFLIALEDVQIKSVRQKGWFAPMGGEYLDLIDATVCPTLRLYLPNRQQPLITVSGKDSIFWEYGTIQVKSEKELVAQASQFAGTIPIKHLLPYWETGKRYLFTGGSVNMRDAAIYAKENNWAEAVRLWEESYKGSKGKKKMYAAYNLALGHEMQDSISTACEWALKAQELAREVDKVDRQNEQGELDLTDVPNYVFTTIYVNELRQREKDLTRLKIQMQRLEE